MANTHSAPVLAKVSIGFAMGAAGTDTATETADVALMDDDLRKLPDFIQLSRDTFHVLRQNITLAIGIKAVFFALALAGKATLWMAVFADMGASLLVVFNGMRLPTLSTVGFDRYSKTTRRAAFLADFVSDIMKENRSGLNQIFPKGVTI